jgi:hypothetical protein
MVDRSQPVSLAPSMALSMSHISNWKGVLYLKHNPMEKNPKFEARKKKWFDRLTILSEVEGQIRISNVPNSKRKSQGNAILVILTFEF